VGRQFQIGYTYFNYHHRLKHRINFQLGLRLLRLFGHIVRSDSDEDHSRALNAGIDDPPKEWRAETSRSSSSNMAAYRRERPQTTESGTVVGPAQSLRLGTVAWNRGNSDALAGAWYMMMMMMRAKCCLQVLTAVCMHWHVTAPYRLSYYYYYWSLKQNKVQCLHQKMQDEDWWRAQTLQNKMQPFYTAFWGHMGADFWIKAPSPLEQPRILRLKVKGRHLHTATYMTLGGAAQVAAAHCPNERTLDPAVCSYNRPTHAPASRTMTFTTQCSPAMTYYF